MRRCTKRTRRRKSERPRDPNHVDVVFDKAMERMSHWQRRRNLPLYNAAWLTVDDLWKSQTLPHYTRGQWLCGFKALQLDPMGVLTLVGLYVGPKKPKQFKPHFVKSIDKLA